MVDIKVEVTLTITRDNTSDSKKEVEGTWAHLFDKHSYVSHVVWSGSKEGWKEVTAHNAQGDTYVSLSRMTGGELRDDLLKVVGERNHV